MLNIYPIALGIDKLEIDSNTVFNVDGEFVKTEIKDINTAELMIKLIDKGTFHGGSTFTDRFGIELPITDLSTGCKAAILVNELRDRKILGFECGENAIGEIVKHYKYGNIIIYEPLSGIFTSTHDKNGKSVSIDARVDNYRFTSLDRLNYYFREERPDNPDMSYGGIQHA